MAPLVEEIYARVFAISLGLNKGWLAPAPAHVVTEGKTLASSRRILVSQTAYILSIVLLSLDLIVAVIYHIYRPKKMLSHPPTTIAVVVEMFRGSSLGAEAKKEGGLDKEVELAYGKFIGIDGECHTGIERQPFAVAGGKC